VWNGSEHVYPEAPAKYGGLAGQPLQPGCIPVSCKATYQVDVLLGTVYAQVRSTQPPPYKMPWWPLGLLDSNHTRCFRGAHMARCMALSNSALSSSGLCTAQTQTMAHGYKVATIMQPIRISIARCPHMMS
jgi:hypothetical protein